MGSELSVCLRRSLHVAALLLTLAGGCAYRPGAQSLHLDSPPNFTPAGDAPQPEYWWTAFDDPMLNANIEQAFRGSFTLAAAVDRVIAARALARREASDLLPDVNGVVDIGAGFGPGEDNDRYTLGFDGGYPVDVWGQIEARVNAERLRAAATRSDYQTVALALSAEIARAWFTLIEAHAQAELVEKQIETNRNGLEAQKLRFAIAGIVRSPDVLRQMQLVESTLEQAAIVRSRIAVLEHQLAVLLGQPPQQADYLPGDQLPTLPPLPETGVPSELLHRRPDVRRDFLAFRAADRDLAAAITDQYPRINLTGSLLNVSERPGDLFRDWFVSIGAQLVAPLIDGGQRRAEVVRTNALLRLRFHEYAQTMLIAFQEVEDALAQERFQLERLEHLERQVELARQASEQLREQYLIGDADYLSVLTSVTAEQRLQRDILTARRDLLLFRVSLYQALAGGFDPCGLPATGLQDFPGIEIDPAGSQVADQDDGPIDVGQSEELPTPEPESDDVDEQEIDEELLELLDQVERLLESNEPREDLAR